MQHSESVPCLQCPDYDDKDVKQSGMWHDNFQDTRWDVKPSDGRDAGLLQETRYRVSPSKGSFWQDSISWIFRDGRPVFGLLEQLQEAGPGNIRDVLIMQSILRVILFRASYWSIDNRQLWKLEHRTIPDDPYLAKGQRMCFRLPKPSPTTARVRFRYAVCDDCEATCGNCNFLATSSDIHTDSDLTSCIELPSVYPLVQYTDAPVDTASTARSLGQSDAAHSQCGHAESLH